MTDLKTRVAEAIEDATIYTKGFPNGHLEVIKTWSPVMAQAALSVIEPEVRKLVKALEDGCLWVEEMGVGINKWAGDAVGLHARQENSNAWKRGVKALLAALPPEWRK